MDIQSSNYNDFQALAGLRREAGQAPDKAVAKVARQFEAVYVQMMLKSMRDTVPEGGLTGDSSTRTYQDMLDGQLAVSLSEKGGGIGLAKVIERQLSHQQNQAVTPAGETAQAPIAEAEAVRLQLSSSGAGRR